MPSFTVQNLLNSVRNLFDDLVYKLRRKTKPKTPNQHKQSSRMAVLEEVDTELRKENPANPLARLAR